MCAADKSARVGVSGRPLMNTVEFWRLFQISRPLGAKRAPNGLRRPKQCAQSGRRVRSDLIRLGSARLWPRSSRRAGRGRRARVGRDFGRATLRTRPSSEGRPASGERSSSGVRFRDGGGGSIGVARVGGGKRIIQINSNARLAQPSVRPSVCLSVSRRALARSLASQTSRLSESRRNLTSH